MRGNFDAAWVMGYGTADAMDDGTSWVSAVILLGLATFTILAFAHFAGVGGLLPAAAAVVWVAVGVMGAVGFAVWLLFGVAAMLYAGVTVLRERLRGSAQEG